MGDPALVLQLGGGHRGCLQVSIVCSGVVQLDCPCRKQPGRCEGRYLLTKRLLLSTQSKQAPSPFLLQDVCQAAGRRF